MTVDINIDVDFFSKIKDDVLENSLKMITSDIEAAGFTPYKTGDTRNSMIKDSKIEDSKITLKNTTDYAEKIYYSPIAFRKSDKAPNATSHWYEAYLSAGGADSICDIVENEIKNKLT